MGSIKDTIDTLKEGVHLGRSIAQKAAERVWTRFMLMVLVGVIFMGPYFAYLTFRIDDYAKKSDDFLTEYQLLQKEDLEQRVLDYLEICIDAQKSNDSNKDYYCQDAVSFYKDSFEGLPNGRLEENIRRSAYGAMKAEMAAKRRATGLMRQDKKLPTVDDSVRFMLSIKGITLACILIAFAMSGTAFMTYRLSRLNHKQDA